MEIYLLLCIVAFGAGFIQGLSGFGSVLLSLPLLALFLDIKTVIPLVALFGEALTIFLLVQLRRHWDWRKIYPLFLGSIPGIPVGVVLLARTDGQLLQIIIGIVLIIYALYGLLFKPVVVTMGKVWAYAFGFTAGFLGGAVSAAGPPVIVYTSLQSWTKDEIKITLQGFFAASGIIVVTCQAVGGLVTGTVLYYFVAGLPLLLVGTWAGSLLYGRIGESAFRRVMLIVMGLLGLFMISG
ncbi:MAG TPA: sulfite exporter TauE/SafE family protein [Deltaproteobacteria bacterium]|nr:sulfite exporter TauE/SafE family protein [Deltaproteobacteria bacterium]